MKKLLLKIIRFYQKTDFLRRPLVRALFLPEHNCRFQPTCSEYSYQAIEKYGIIKGILLGLRRIFKCNPWNKGGNDSLK